MIGAHLFHPLSGEMGFVDAVAEHPDGRLLVRIDDRWFFADETVAP